MASMSHGPRTLATKPGSVTVPIPLVLDEHDLAKVLHGLITKSMNYCHHVLGAEGQGKLCEELAKELTESRVTQSATDFLGMLKSSPVVQKIIQEAMAEAWQQGAHAQDEDKNPYE